MLRRPAWPAALAADRRCAAALEFAVVAPMMAAMLLGVVDVSRALIVWQEACNAAAAVVQAASRLSVATDPTVSALTATQMQNAMSVIYAEIPGLGLGAGTGTYTGSFSVTLSSVVFVPLCAASSGCASQTPYTLWSASLSEGGSQLTTSMQRSCGALTAVASLSSSSARLTQMLSPLLVSGAASMTLVPQLVADVQYTYKPLFSLFVKTVTFWATAALPAPINGTEQEVTLDTSAGTSNVVTCTLPSS